MIVNTSNTWWSFSCDDANDWLKNKRKKKEWHLQSHENKCNILHDITYYSQDDTISKSPDPWNNLIKPCEISWFC